MSSAPHFGILTVECYLPNSHSLKEKRMVSQSVKARLRQKFNVSVAETDHLELWQRLTLAIGLVGGSAGHISTQMVQIENWLVQELLGKAEIINLQADLY